LIVFPENWDEVGNDLKIDKVEASILEVISGIDCNCLALSGGIDSSLLLHFMVKSGKRSVYAFTIGSSKDHPDIIHSKMAVNQYECVVHNIHIPASVEGVEKFKGDNAVRELYRFIGGYSDSVIAGDGIDEYMCGYYDHKKKPTEEVYYDFINRLQEEQLIPLDENSGKVKVYLPYIDSRIIYLLSQIPIARKVGFRRKLLMIEMAKRAGICEGIINRRKYGFCSALEAV
jgi:asparagine synthetase B (glutamine-hydrolysing)